MSQLTFVVTLFFVLFQFVGSFRLRDLSYDDYGEFNFADKRGDLGPCPPWKPFMCPEGECIHVAFLCDGNPECTVSHYDENPRLCTAKHRPPVEYTESFLEDLLDIYGDNYFVKFFGPLAANRLSELGGPQKLAIAFSESRTINDFGKELGLPQEAISHLAQIFSAIIENDENLLASLDLKPSEVVKLRMYFGKLVETGFLKNRQK